MANNAKPNFSAAYSKANEILVKSRIISTFPFSPIELVKEQSAIRLISGGHGQTGIDQLDKYGIKYNIVKTYPNGVRVGNVPDHKTKAKKEGIGQSWFPKSWTVKDIRRAGEHVAGLKVNRHAPDGKKLCGTYKGVRVIVIKTHGKIATVFPDSIQPTRRNKK